MIVCKAEWGKSVVSMAERLIGYEKYVRPDFFLMSCRLR